MNANNAFPEENKWDADIRISEGFEAFGFTSAGQHMGAPEGLNVGLESALSKLMAGSAKDDDAIRGKQSELRTQVDVLKKERENVENERRTIVEVSIPGKEDSLKSIKAKKDELKLDKLSGRLKAGYQPAKAIVLTTLLVINVFFVVLYYASLLYTIFYKDHSALLLGNSLDLSVLFRTVFDEGLFSWQPGLIICYLAPFMFMTLGLAPHLFPDIIGGEKHRAWIKAALYLVAFCFDVLLAYQIEKNVYDIKLLMGIADGSFSPFTSSLLWILVGFGFVSYVLTALLAVVVSKEFEKRNPEFYFLEQIRHLENSEEMVKKEITGLQTAIKEKEGLVKQVDIKLESLEKELKSTPIRFAYLNMGIENFWKGWLRFLNGLENAAGLKTKCEQVYRNFRAVHLKGERVSPIHLTEEVKNGNGLNHKTNAGGFMSRFINTFLLLILLSFTAMAQKHFVAALDLSDRLITTPYCAQEDIARVEKLFADFEKSARKDYLFKSADIFSVRIIPQSGSPLDGHGFEKQLQLNLAALPAGSRASAFKSLKERLPVILKDVYKKARFSEKTSLYQGVDIWRFFNEEVPYISPEGYQTTILLLTDGQFTFESYTHSIRKDNRFTHTKFVSQLKGVDWQKEAVRQNLGILPTRQEIKGVNVLVCGLQRRATDDLLVIDKLRYFLSQWFRESGIKRIDFV